MEYISFNEFKKLDIRVGTVKEINPVPDSDKLLMCSIDFGEKNEKGDPEFRTIVSGIREYYPLYEKLIGKQLLYIVNLEPRTIRGVESHGMLLAVGGTKPIFLIPEEFIPAGSKVR